MIGDLVKRWLLPGDTEVQDESTEAQRSTPMGHEASGNFAQAGPPGAIDPQRQMVGRGPAGMDGEYEVGALPLPGQQAPQTTKPSKKSLLSFLRARGGKHPGTAPGRGSHHDGSARSQGPINGLRQGSARGPGFAPMQPMQGGQRVPGRGRPRGESGVMGPTGMPQRTLPLQPSPRYPGDWHQGYPGQPMRYPNARPDTRADGPWDGRVRAFRGYQHLPGPSVRRPRAFAPLSPHLPPGRPGRPLQRRLPPGPPWL